MKRNRYPTSPWLNFETAFYFLLSQENHKDLQTLQAIRQRAIETIDRMISEYETEINAEGVKEWAKK